jgi:hypothetical protein
MTDRPERYFLLLLHCEFVLPLQGAFFPMEKLYFEALLR